MLQLESQSITGCYSIEIRLLWELLIRDYEQNGKPGDVQKDRRDLKESLHLRPVMKTPRNIYTGPAGESLCSEIEDVVIQSHSRGNRAAIAAIKGHSRRHYFLQFLLHFLPEYPYKLVSVCWKPTWLLLTHNGLRVERDCNWSQSTWRKSLVTPCQQTVTIDRIVTAYWN